MIPLKNKKIVAKVINRGGLKIQHHLIVNDLITGKDYGIVRDTKTGKYDYYRKG